MASSSGQRYASSNGRRLPSCLAAVPTCMELASNTYCVSCSDERPFICVANTGTQCMVRGEGSRLVLPCKAIACLPTCLPPYHRCWSVACMPGDQPSCAVRSALARHALAILSTTFCSHWLDLPCPSHLGCRPGLEWSSVVRSLSSPTSPGLAPAVGLALLPSVFQACLTT